MTDPRYYHSQDLEVSVSCGRLSVYYNAQQLCAEFKEEVRRKESKTRTWLLTHRRGLPQPFIGRARERVLDSIGYVSCAYTLEEQSMIPRTLFISLHFLVTSYPITRRSEYSLSPSTYPITPSGCSIPVPHGTCPAPSMTSRPVCEAG